MILAIRRRATELTGIIFMVHFVCALLLILGRAAPTTQLPEWEGDFDVIFVGVYPVWSVFHILEMIAIVVASFRRDKKTNHKHSPRAMAWACWSSCGVLAAYGLSILAWALTTSTPVSLLAGPLVLLFAVLSGTTARSWADREG